MVNYYGGQEVTAYMFDSKMDQMRKQGDYLRSDLSQNILKLILKSPRFFPILGQSDPPLSQT